MSRTADPLSGYRVRIHRNHGYLYASTQPRVTDPRTGRQRYLRRHWGTLTPELKFMPNAAFRLLDPGERSQMIFPAEWDMSEAAALLQPAAQAAAAAPPDGAGTASDSPETGAGGRSAPAPDEDAAAELNLLYGDVMLCEHAAERLGLREDLEQALHGRERAEVLLSLAIYLRCTMQPLCRAGSFQRIMKLPTPQVLTPAFITRFLQSVTASEQMRLMDAGLQRLQAGTLLAVDSTTRAAYGSSLAEIRMGRSKERIIRPQTVEVVAYDLQQHLPVYFRTLQGNVPDSRTLETIVRDLHGHARGSLQEVVLITDRGYASLHNFRVCMERGQPFLTAVRTAQNPVLQRIEQLGGFEFMPEGMDFDPAARLCYKQYDLSAWAGEKGLPGGGQLRLNLYLDPAQRCAALSDLHAALAEQCRQLQEHTGITLSEQERGELARSCPLCSLICADDGATLCDYRVNDDELSRQRRTAGFFASISYGVEWDALQAHRSYKLRDEQEKYFARMKGQLDGHCQRAWTESSRSGRELLLFAAGRISSWLNHIRSTALAELPGGRGLRSVSEMLDEMRCVRLIRHAGDEPFLTPLVGRQHAICKALGLRADEHVQRWASPQPARGRPGRRRSALNREQAN